MSRRECDSRAENSAKLTTNSMIMLVQMTSGTSVNNWYTLCTTLYYPRRAYEANIKARVHQIVSAHIKMSNKLDGLTVARVPAHQILRLLWKVSYIGQAPFTDNKGGEFGSVVKASITLKASRRADVPLPAPTMLLLSLACVDHPIILIISSGGPGASFIQQLNHTYDSCRVNGYVGSNRSAHTGLVVPHAALASHASGIQVDLELDNAVRRAMYHAHHAEERARALLFQSRLLSTSTDPGSGRCDAKDKVRHRPRSCGARNYNIYMDRRPASDVLIDVRRATSEARCEVGVYRVREQQVLRTFKDIELKGNEQSPSDKRAIVSGEQTTLRDGSVPRQVGCSTQDATAGIRLPFTVRVPQADEFALSGELPAVHFCVK
ncbi:uncharacterized protein B0H18DRAFT_958859 [Fomitopsis serialis]|uniref:uncharacterized protein n=1 Tax=Fomitopsis serialis TaxID=139415 RepID=UPI0020081F4D|nr:uncharacterized protein B0H18DRAFT_958855 [Neoantrodia serialis]XP_047887705.1 uncharacterized protein B0H18DRAFT_958859 [Neoantrodia serialis]KAH9916448.1 hypothetical protein B0H18DRAFT_958855 [Neoantrodia serialis]KAH9916453.1 hypothetical protein B0H18DRAFT_958859 [Neoantrodia serialis]